MASLIYGVPLGESRTSRTFVANVFSTECQQLTCETACALAGSLDFTEISRELVVLAHALQNEIGVPQNGGQKIVEVMGDAPRETTYRLHLLGLRKFPFQSFSRDSRT